MTKFSISDSQDADMCLTIEHGSRCETIEFNMMTGKGMDEAELWNCATQIERYLDVVLRILDHLWESHPGLDDPGFISSPASDKQQFLRWLFVEELLSGESKWTRGFKQALEDK